MYIIEYRKYTYHNKVAMSKPTPTNSIKTTHKVKRINAKKLRWRTSENPIQETGIK
jgi:hypothetical protein